jgi:phosphoserine aminotransferase
VQFSSEPESGNVPLVCDSSSDFLSRPVPIKKYGILYACAQKNAGPAGVTIVILRQDLLDHSPGDLPSMLSYRVLADKQSLLNTPPVFAVYMVKLVTDWLLGEVGGLEKMLRVNREKAELLYDVIDRCDGFYDGHADPGSRSLMNVTFRLPNDALQDKFLEEAAARDLVALKGHRSVGGFRASIYNAMPMEGVRELRDLMLEFYETNQP